MEPIVLHVTTLGKITKKDSNQTKIQELDLISNVVYESKSKGSEICCKFHWPLDLLSCTMWEIESSS